MLRHIRLLAILIEMVYLYAWASGASAKFAGMPHKLKFYQKKSAERKQDQVYRYMFVPCSFQHLFVINHITPWNTLGQHIAIVT